MFTLHLHEMKRSYVYTSFAATSCVQVILTDQQLPKRFLEQMKINFECILEEQSRQENEEQHMSIDICPLIDRFRQLVR